MKKKTHKLSKEDELEIARTTLLILGFSNISDEELESYSLSYYKKRPERKEKYTDWVKRAKLLVDGLQNVLSLFKKVGNLQQKKKTKISKTTLPKSKTKTSKEPKTKSVPKKQKSSGA